MKTAIIQSSLGRTLLPSLLAALLLLAALPAGAGFFDSMRKKNDTVTCKNTLKQVALGLLVYADDNNDYLPASLDVLVEQRYLPQGGNLCPACKKPYVYYGKETLPTEKIDKPFEFILVACPTKHQDDLTNVAYADCHVASVEESALPQGNTSAGGRLGAIRKAGKLVVHTNAMFPPYEYRNGKGDIAGSEIDLVYFVANKLGVGVEFVDVDFNTILPAVAAGKADLGASGFTCTEERSKVVDFSVPFIRHVAYLVLPEKSPVKYVEDLAGRKVGGLVDTWELSALEECAREGVLQGKRTAIERCASVPDAVAAVSKGTLDALVVDDLLADYLKGEGGCKVIPLVKADGGSLGSRDDFGIAVPKGREDLLAIVNAAIAEAHERGFMAAWQAKHYGYALSASLEKAAIQAARPAVKSAASQGPKLVDLTSATFNKEIAQGVWLVDFWASWCGPCREQGKLIEANLDALTANGARIGRVNVDKEGVLADRFKIEAIPTLIVFKDGKQVGKPLVGYKNLQQLQKALGK